MGEGIRSSLLLELDPEGRFSHLELSTPVGLLTLHPEADGTLHGNAVTSTGVDHVRGLPWSSDVIVIVDGSAVCRAIAASQQRADLDALDIGPTLSLKRIRVTPDPADVTSDGLPALGGGTTSALDEDG